MQDLVAESKLLKVSLKELAKLQSLLRDCEAWENDALSLLESAECLFNMQDIGIEITNGLSIKIDGVLDRINIATTAGLSLGFDFVEIPKLQNAYSTLQWCLKALSFCSSTPFLEVSNSMSYIPFFFLGKEVNDILALIYLFVNLCYLAILSLVIR